MSSEETYSRAFENIVENSGDVIGLLAYAMFKETVRQDAGRGVLQDGKSRNPAPGTVDAFRSAAEQRLSEIIRQAIEEATPDIERNATVLAVSSAESEIKAHVDRRTSFKTALGSNLVAWLLTLALAAIIIFVSDRKSLDSIIAEKMETMRVRQEVLPTSQSSAPVDNKAQPK